jgi:CheY-like chemotaxis protein
MAEDKIKVLIVEDNSIVVMLLTETLTQMGHHVLGSVSSGEQALADMTELQPDLLIVDIHLEGEMSGIDTVEKIKKNQKIAVIYLTGDLTSETIAMGKKTKPNAYLKKPIDINQLKMTIEMIDFDDYKN